MNRLLILLLLLAFQLSGFSQHVVEGTVKDSLQQPLVNANIIAIPQDSLESMKFSITSENGRYRLDLKETPYTITVSFMGYESVSFEILPSENTERDIVLSQQSKGLEEVVIDIPMIVKKDTIIYNIDSFTTGKERKLKDVLSKLPGVEVDRDGKVRVQGKEVTVLLVENKKFFGGGTKLGVDNIPANAVHQVEVLDNYNEVAFLKDLHDSEDMALNIKLKEDKKSFAFGDIEAGKGNQDFYRTHANLFYYAPKTNLNVIGNLNNIGDQVLTYSQYSNFQLGMNPILKRGATSFDVSSADLRQFIGTPDVVSSRRQFGALNFTQDVNNRLNISGYGIFSNTDENSLNRAVNQYNNFTETTDSRSGRDNRFSIGNLNAAYLPNLQEQWHFKTQFKTTDSQSYNDIQSVVDTTANNFLTNRSLQDQYFQQVIEWHLKKSNTHTFSFAADYTFNQRSPMAQWLTSDSSLLDLLPLEKEDIYNVRQSRRMKDHKLDAVFKHYWVIDRNNHLHSTIGNTYIDQEFFSRDLQEMEDGSIQDFSSVGFGNDLDFRFNDFFIGLNYKIRLGILTLDNELFLHHYSWRTAQENVLTQDKLVLLPSFTAKAEIDNRRELNFDYNLRSGFSDASRFASRYYLSSYNTVFRGNEELENSLQHNFRLTFSRRPTYRSVSYSASAHYTKHVKGVQSAIVYEGVNRILTTLLLDDPETRWGVSGNISKRFWNLDLRLILLYNASEYLQQVNEQLETNQNQQGSYRLSAKTLMEDFPIVEMGFRHGIGHFSMGRQKSESVTTEPYVNLDYDFWDGFIASFDYSAYQYRNKTMNQRNQHQMANASLYYKKDSSAWSFQLEARNLFDVEFKNMHSFSSYIISDMRTYILPRILMFTIGYNL